MDLKRLLLGGTLIQRLVEYFSTDCVPASGAWFSNVFNGWDIWTAYNSSGWGYGNVSGGAIRSGGGGNGNSGRAILYRTKENYNLNKDYDISYAYTIERYSSGFPFVFRLSIGGTPSDGDTTQGGLEFRLDRGNTNNFAIYNNGTLLAVPYSGLGASTYFVFIKKRGLQISVTLNTTGAQPTNYDFTYTMTNTGSTSNGLTLNLYAHGFGETGWTSGNIDNLNVLVIG